jgi:hypothetical protein
MMLTLLFTLHMLAANDKATLSLGDIYVEGEEEEENTSL